MEKKFALGLLLIGFLASFAVVGSAGAVTYDPHDLIRYSSTVTAGDESFSRFGYAPAPGALFIGITPITRPLGGPGLQFADSVSPLLPAWGELCGFTTNAEISLFVQMPTSTPMAGDGVLLPFNGRIGNNGSPTVSGTLPSSYKTLYNSLGGRLMMRFVTLLIFIMVGYFFFRYVIRMLKQGMDQRSESGGYRYRNWEHANTEEDYRRILGVTDKDSPATIRKKYKELLAKYHPDKVQHLGIEFQELAERKTKAIIQAYEFFRKK